MSKKSNFRKIEIQNSCVVCIHCKADPEGIYDCPFEENQDEWIGYDTICDYFKTKKQEKLG